MAAGSQPTGAAASVHTAPATSARSAGLGCTQSALAATVRLHCTCEVVLLCFVD